LPGKYVCAVERTGRTRTAARINKENADGIPHRVIGFLYRRILDISVEFLFAFVDFTAPPFTDQEPTDQIADAEGRIYMAKYTSDLGSWSLFTVERTPPVSIPPSRVYTKPKIDLSVLSLQWPIMLSTIVPFFQTGSNKIS
jgi:hypothetical protein